MPRTIARNLLAAALFAALVVAVAVPALASKGDPMIVGERNRGDRATTILQNNGLRSTLRVINGKGGYALDLRTDGPGPVLRVSNSARIPNLNADLVDGLDARKLQTRTAWCSNDNLGTTDWTCTMNITVPSPGNLIMSGSVDMQNFQSVVGDPWCYFALDGTVISASSRYLHVEPNRRAVCASDAAHGVAAGSYTVTFHTVVDRAPMPPYTPVNLDAGTAHVVFIPNN